MKTLLIPTDFSPIAREALYYALEFTHNEPTRVILLHVFDVDYTFGLAISNRIRDDEGIKLEQLESLRQTLQDNDDYKHIKFEIMLHTGSLTYIARDVAERNKIDYIVMGTKGETDANNRIFGSETAKLIHQSEVPVLSVPRGSHLKGLKNILYATDYRERDLTIIGDLVEIARKFGATLHIVHVNKESGLDTQMRYRGFKDIVNEQYTYEHITHQLIITEKLLEGLNDYVTLHEQALLCMCYYKKSFFQSLFKDSKAEDMAYMSKAPLLVFRA
ncbi:MAG: universal stress protein [Thermonemataceae bacterium]